MNSVKMREPRLDIESRELFRQCFAAKRKTYQMQGRAKAQNKELLHHAGCMLYWAEGSENRKSAIFTNTDPQMIELFVKFLKEYFPQHSEAIRLTCCLYPDHIKDRRSVKNTGCVQHSLLSKNLAN